MKVLTALIAMMGMLAMAHANPQVGAQAPMFSGTTTSGETFNLSDQAGKNVILEWTNHDCPFVVKHYGAGNMQAMQKRETAKGVVWVTIISSAPGKQGHVSAAQADELTTSRGAKPSYVILDESGEIGRMYDAKTTPHMYVIDQGQVLQYAGAIDSIPSANPADIARADNYVSTAMNSLRAGQPVVTKQTQPYGCSVKYGS